MEEDLWYDIYDDSEPVIEEIYDDDNDISWEEDDPTTYEYEAPGFTEMVHTCVAPTLGDISAPVGKLLINCLLIRICTKTGVLPRSAINLISIVSSSWLLYDYFKEQAIYLFIFCVMAYVTLRLGHDLAGVSCGPPIVFVTVTHLVVCELFVVNETHWHNIRGSQMVLAMKAISVGFDIDRQQISPLPSFFYYAGYCLCPSTVLFGPWTSYNTYLKSLQMSPTTNLWWILKFFGTLLAAIFFLTLSTCWTHWIFQESVLENFSSRWLPAYRDALSYRSSHYFVSYVSEAACSLSGLPLDLHVADPQHIEVPRSLVDVVTHWNMPMHFWLKIYVFKVVRPYGNFVAVIATYAASSLLHGLNFQLAAVLLSLGFYTYVEYVLRQKLSKVFSACIQAKRCPNECTHDYKHSHPSVRLTNLAFGALALFHLTYLGLMFDSTPSLEEKGYSVTHTLSKWGELSFASHWVAIATYVFHILL